MSGVQLCRIWYSVHMKNKDTTLLVKRETYRLWFEFYKLCCLSNRTDIKLNLKTSREFYKSWGGVTTVKFDDWWKTHDHLFQEPMIKVLDDLSLRQTTDSLIIEVPLNQSTSVLVETLKKLIDEKREKFSKKKKSKFSGSYQLTEGSEPKLKTFRNVLNIYRDVYLSNNRPKIPKLLPMIEQYYNSKKRMTIPTSLDTNINDLDNVLRNLGRWMKWGDKITLNVSRDEFPGEY